MSYDKDEYEKALAWTKKWCKEGKDYNPKAIQKTRDQKDADWEYVVKIVLLRQTLPIELGSLQQ